MTVDIYSLSVWYNELSWEEPVAEFGNHFVERPPFPTTFIWRESKAQSTRIEIYQEARMDVSSSSPYSKIIMDNRKMSGTVVSVIYSFWIDFKCRCELKLRVEVCSFRSHFLFFSVPLNKINVWLLCNRSDDAEVVYGVNKNVWTRDLTSELFENKIFIFLINDWAEIGEINKSYECLN